jgi:hypothetical protein
MLETRIFLVTTQVACKKKNTQNHPNIQNLKAQKNIKSLVQLAQQDMCCW